MIRINELKIFYSIILIAPFSSGVLASDLKEMRNNQMVYNTILEIKTVEAEKYSYRAIIGKSKSNYYLKIEKFERSPKLDGLGKLIETIDAFTLPGGKDIKAKDNWCLTDLKWTASGITFKNESASGSILKTLNCEINIFSSSPVITCK